MKLVLIRHGESVWNKENRFTGWTDVDLSETGVAEAKAAGDILIKEGYDFDVAYTSYLKRAIHTLNGVLQEMDREWIPVIKSWKLNEKHYGALQGLNKAETAAQYGDEQVKIWRRSFDTPSPELKDDDPRSPRLSPQYRAENSDELPMTESLKDTINRTVPYFESVIKPDMQSGRRVIIAAHGNSLRSLVKHFDRLTDAEIMEVNIPTAVPLVYEFDVDFNVVNKHYLGDQEAIKAKMESVANQGKAK